MKATAEVEKMGQARNAKMRNPNGPVNVHLRRGVRGFRWSVTLSGECVGFGKEPTRNQAHDAAAAVALKYGRVLKPWERPA